MKLEKRDSIVFFLCKNKIPFTVEEDFIKADTDLCLEKEMIKLKKWVYVSREKRLKIKREKYRKAILKKRRMNKPKRKYNTQKRKKFNASKLEYDPEKLMEFVKKNGIVEKTLDISETAQNPVVKIKRVKGEYSNLRLYDK